MTYRLRNNTNDWLAKMSLTKGALWVAELDRALQFQTRNDAEQARDKIKAQAKRHGVRHYGFVRVVKS